MTCSSKAPSTTHARRCGEPDRGLGDVPALRRRRSSSHPRRRCGHAHPGARCPDRLGGNAGGHLASEEPAQRFLALLRAALSSHRAHVADATTEPNPDAACWGWQLVIGSGGYERKEWCPNGERLGWIRDGVLLLDPDAAFAATQKLARDQGTAIPVKQRTLWKRLAEQGLLASRDQARGTNTVRRTIGGLRREVIHLKASTFAVETDQRAPQLPKLTSSRPKKVNRISAAASLASLARK